METTVVSADDFFQVWHCSPTKLFSISAARDGQKIQARADPAFHKLFLTAATICAVMARPKSAAMSAASSSSSDSAVSLGERVTMRLISCVELGVRFGQAGFEFGEKSHD